jgi:alkaline phosphatase
MKTRSRFLPAGLLAVPLLLGSCGAQVTRPADAPTRVILLIADGAGVAHWTLAAFADDNVSVARMGTVGLVDTRGSDHTVSGSAPTASAYATGVRTFMGAISVGPDSLPRETVLEAAMARGLSTGLITTTAIVDATPAAFGAHAVSRAELGDIARQMANKGITVLMGGGRVAFGSAMQPGSTELFTQIRSRSTYVESVEELRDLDPDTIDSLVGLLAEGEMGTVAVRGDALTTMTSVALDILDRNPAGFFLMIENEESDSQAHANRDQATVTAEMLDFDAAVGLALDYQAEHPETLVLVTGDHETGGISLTYDPSDPDREVVMQYASGGHTGALIPIFATGPGAERFGGIIRNDRVGQILMEVVRGEG